MTRDGNDVKALQEAFELYTQTTRTLEESYRRLEERLRSLDQELQRKNQELALTTDYLNSILDSMSDGVIAVDVHGVITTFNRAAATALGIPAFEAVGRPFRELFGRQFVVSAGPVAQELTARNGRTVRVAERNSTIADHANTRLGTVKVFQDLSEIEALREQVRTKDRLAAIGEMAATVAHEIRNPLGGIRGFASLLQQDIDSDDPRARLAEKIVQGTKSLDRVVNELLEYTRPVDLRLEPVNCHEIVTAAMGYLDLDGRRVDVANNVGRDLYVTADGGKVRQVLLNILINGIQSIDTEGAIDVDGRAEDGWVSLIVRDTGRGIHEADLKHVFSPFFTTREKGTGLGLAIASKIIESHGGTIGVESAIGRGSTFRIRLPIGERPN